MALFTSRNFKCEDLKIALSNFSERYFMFKFDLKSGYHYVEIFSEHTKFPFFA